jgi:hypothetical protein
MTKITVAVLSLAVLAFPASAAATPSEQDKQSAQKECRTERGKSAATREAFEAKYRSMSRCVGRTASEEEAEEGEARENAARTCKAERKKLGVQAFADRYGTNANKRNAFGKCVSMKARQEEADMDAEDEQEAKEFRNAAKECAAERRTKGEEAFAEQYGTNANKRNAFGKCVSGKVRDA